MLSRLFDWLAPRRCAACAVVVPSARAFCTSCASTVVRAHTEPSLLAPFEFGGALATAITRWKFEDALGVGETLVQLFAAELRAVDLRGCVLIPVPAHPLRLAERGFNPPALLAAALARQQRIPVRHWLRRRRDTPKQSRLDRAERHRNLQGAFAFVGPARPLPPIVLIDDVRTTGATLHACRAALREVSAVSVRAAVLASTPPSPRERI